MCRFFPLETAVQPFSVKGLCTTNLNIVIWKLMCWTQPQSFHCQQSNTDDTQSKCNRFTCELYARGGHYISSDASKGREGGFDFCCGFFFCAPHPSCFSPRAEFWAYTERGILYVFSNTKYFPFFGFMDMIKHQLSMFAYPGERVPEAAVRLPIWVGKRRCRFFSTVKPLFFREFHSWHVFARCVFASWVFILYMYIYIYICIYIR